MLKIAQIQCASIETFGIIRKQYSFLSFFSTIWEDFCFAPISKVLRPCKTAFRNNIKIA